MPVTLATHAMGTRFELVLDGGDPRHLRAAGEAALQEIRELHAKFNLFDPGSWLNTINRRAAVEPVALDGLTFGLLRMCRQVYEQSGGAFDITVAPLMRAWGFHGEQINTAPPLNPPPSKGGAGGGMDYTDSNEQSLQPSTEPPLSQPLPSGERGYDHVSKIEQAKTCVGMRHVELDDDAKTIRFTRPGMTLDLGGVAKGFAIDQAVELLHDAGVTCALLHGGTSTVAAIGAPPDEDGWRIRLDNPNGPMPEVVLNDASLSVSAPHGRTIESGGDTLGHVLDPRTSRPAKCRAFAAAVGRSACMTDAWATALLVLGERPTAMPRSIESIFPDNTQAFTETRTMLEVSHA